MVQVFPQGRAVDKFCGDGGEVFQDFRRKQGEDVRLLEAGERFDAQGEGFDFFGRGIEEQELRGFFPVDRLGAHPALGHPAGDSFQKFVTVGKENAGTQEVVVFWRGGRGSHCSRGG